MNIGILNVGISNPFRINASHHFVGAIPLFSPPLSFHNFSILVLADHHHHLPISKATQTSAADLAGSSFQLVKQ